MEVIQNTEKCHSYMEFEFTQSVNESTKRFLSVYTVKHWLNIIVWHTAKQEQT
jgi:hypothetical protein